MNNKHLDAAMRFSDETGVPLSEVIRVIEKNQSKNERYYKSQEKRANRYAESYRKRLNVDDDYPEVEQELVLPKSVLNAYKDAKGEI